jgi:uncharacterized Zn-finger protein
MPTTCSTRRQLWQSGIQANLNSQIFRVRRSLSRAHFVQSHSIKILIFGNSSDLKKHSRGHTGEKLFYCSMCEKSIRDSKYFKIHIRIHTGEKPFTCSLCEKSFTSPSQLRQHSRVHTGEKPFKCPH